MVASGPAVARGSKAATWAPCLAMMAVSLISYIDRSVLSILSPTILAALHLTVKQYGLVVSAFSICYMIGNPLWGYIIDRAGLYWSIIVAVVIWSIAAGAHAVVGGLVGMCVGRAVLGFGEGATFPAGLTTVAETLPPEKRSFGVGLSYSGGALGAALTPLIVSPLAAAFGWRAAFLFTSVLGFVWIALWIALRASGRYKVVATHDNNDEVERIRPARERGLTGRSLLQRLGLTRAVAATAALYGLGAQPLAAGLYVAPLYLSRELHQTQASLGHLLWIPPLGWEIGYLAFGRLSDNKLMPIARRPGAVFAALSICGLTMAVIPYLNSLVAVMVLLWIAMFIAGGFVVLSLSQGLAAQRGTNPGLLAGICVAAWSVAVAVLMPVIGDMFDQRQYTHAFWLVAIMPAIGTLFWSLLKQRPASVALEG